MSNHPTLFTLPPELRLQIYTYVLGPPKPLLLSPPLKTNAWAPPPICRTSRFLRQETTPLYFHLHDFTYDLHSPLDTGLTNLETVLKSLDSQGLRLRCLRFKHVNRGVLSVAELEAWVRIMSLHRCVLPSSVENNVTFCQGPLRYREVAAKAAVALRQLVRFASTLDVRIWGSGEEGVVGEWCLEQLQRTEEGRVVLRGLRFAAEVVRGFRDAGAAGMSSGLEWSGSGSRPGELMLGSSTVSVS